MERAALLFELYPDIQKGYNLTQELRGIFENTTDKIIGFAKLARWHEKVDQSGFKSFGTISRTIMNHYQTILNYFDNRSTNASAESFNAKIKAFRSKFRGVRNIEYFLLSIDETSLSNGELYTILTNKSGKGRKGIITYCCGEILKSRYLYVQSIPQCKILLSISLSCYYLR
ncbi:ISL3 family transposase [Flavobacterium sp. RS13.1]|uniref:ISL3 family transposase n=1 Tax=Flavobacterium sp. RS13.1 TaxID=3400345 RepID=UPI003AAF381F